MPLLGCLGAGLGGSNILAGSAPTDSRALQISKYFPTSILSCFDETITSTVSVKRVSQVSRLSNSIAWSDLMVCIRVEVSASGSLRSDLSRAMFSGVLPYRSGRLTSAPRATSNFTLSRSACWEWQIQFITVLLAVSEQERASDDILHYILLTNIKQPWVWLEERVNWDQSPTQLYLDNLTPYV